MIDRIVLASSSPRRKEILEKFNISFDVIPSDVDEYVDSYSSSGEYVGKLAALKGRSVRDELLKNGENLSNTLIISCDTVVVWNNEILGKPIDKEDAYKTVLKLSDSYHDVYSGLSLILGNDEYCDYAKTRVNFTKISEEEAKIYVDSGEPMGKAGSYAIQLMGGAFVSSIDGDFNNIVGFPLSLFCEMIKKHFDLSIFDLGNIK